MVSRRSFRQSKNGGRSRIIRRTATSTGPSRTAFRRDLAASLCFLLVWIPAHQSAEAGHPPRPADFFIVERPGALRIYDSYQQPVREPGREGILPFTPFKIVAWKTVMGDGLTPCSIVELQGKRFFLLRDAETRLLIGENRAGHLLTIRGAEILDDTLVVTAPRGVTLSPPGKSVSTLLTTGDRLVRLFRSRDKTYGLADRNGGAFGWISFPEGAARSAASPLHDQAGAGSFSSVDIESRIRSTVDETNATLRRLYTFLDSESGIHLEPPQWSVERADGSIACLLRTAQPSTTYAESTAHLAKRIEGRLLGSGYSVQHQPGRIEIRP